MGSIPLSAVAELGLVDGPPMINSDNAMLRGAVLFNVRGRDLGNTVQEAIRTVNEEVNGMPEGYYLEWAGQYENMIRVRPTLLMIAPAVLLIIFLGLYMAFKSIREARLRLFTVPFARCGEAFIL